MPVISGDKGQQERKVSLVCYIPAPLGANRSEPCLCPGRKKKEEAGLGMAHPLAQIP